MPVNLSQYRGTVGLFNSRSIVNRSKVNNFVTSNYRNNTYIACSLISVNKIFLFLSLFSVLLFLRDNVSKNNRRFPVFISIINSVCLFFSILVSLSGDVDVNPVPNRKPNEALSIFRWNLNSISAHNFTKLHLLKAYVTVHKLDIICLTRNISCIPFDDNNLETSGYNLIRSDHPSNSKRGGACIYYNNFLPIRVCDISF